jgi:hypothetical protein
VIIDGIIFCTGHDDPELYELRFPGKGFTLQGIDTHPLGSFGQGIACEKKSEKLWIYGIVRDENTVIVSEITPKD